MDTWRVGLSLVVLSLSGIAGCAAMQGRLASSAGDLERSAHALAQDAGGSTALGYSREAQQFADEAGDFRRLVEDSGVERKDVEEAFGELSRRYHALRDAVEDADSRTVDLDFKEVTESYLDVEREVRRQTGWERYAGE